MALICGLVLLKVRWGYKAAKADSMKVVHRNAKRALITLLIIGALFFIKVKNDFELSDSVAFG